MILSKDFNGKHSLYLHLLESNVAPEWHIYKTELLISQFKTAIYSWECKEHT